MRFEGLSLLGGAKGLTMESKNGKGCRNRGGSLFAAGDRQGWVACDLCDLYDLCDPGDPEPQRYVLAGSASGRPGGPSAQYPFPAFLLPTPMDQNFGVSTTLHYETGQDPYDIIFCGNLLWELRSSVSFFQYGVLEQSQFTQDSKGDSEGDGKGDGKVDGKDKCPTMGLPILRGEVGRALHPGVQVAVPRVQAL